MLRARRALVLPALGLSAALLLAGCGDDDKKVTLDGTDYSVSNDGDDVKVSSTAGTFEGSTGKLPDGFPADEIPLVDGDVDGGFGSQNDEGSGWTIVVTVDDAASAFDDAVQRLKDAGFAQESDANYGGTGLSTLKKAGEWTVTVMSDPEENKVSYIVATPKS